MTVEREERLYRFEPLDESGIFLGLGVFQCALLGSGLVIAVLLTTAGAPLLIAAAPALLSGGASFVRIGGRVAWEWIPLGVSWLLMRFGRGPRWYARLPLLGDGDAPAPPLPPCLAGLDIIGIPWRGGLAMAAVRDRNAHTLTAVLPVSGPEFVTQPRTDQERLLTGWADVLGQFAPERSPVVHLGWCDLARQSGLRQHVDWLEGTERGPVDTEAADSYRQLLDGAVNQASSHETLLFLTVAEDKLPRRSLSDDPEAGVARALTGCIETLLRGLRNAGLSAGDPLDPPALRRHLRSRIDPFSSRPRPNGGRLVERLGLVAPGAEGPLALDAAWRHLHLDGAVHRTYWIAGLPRLPQHPGWLEPFLASTGLCRSVTVFFRPVPPHQSRRRIERDLVKLESDAQTREDKGRRVDARHRRATQALLDREEELVAGYTEMGHLALVSVAAPDLDQLEDDCDVLEQAAREAGLDVRPVDARQDLAWASSLPFGLAPRHLLS